MKLSEFCARLWLMKNKVGHSHSHTFTMGFFISLYCSSSLSWIYVVASTHTHACTHKSAEVLADAYIFSLLYLSHTHAHTSQDAVHHCGNSSRLGGWPFTSRKVRSHGSAWQRSLLFEKEDMGIWFETRKLCLHYFCVYMLYIYRNICMLLLSDLFIYPTNSLNSCPRWLKGGNHLHFFRIHYHRVGKVKNIKGVRCAPVYPAFLWWFLFCLFCKWKTLELQVHHA